MPFFHKDKPSKSPPSRKQKHSKPHHSNNVYLQAPSQSTMTVSTPYLAYPPNPSPGPPRNTHTPVPPVPVLQLQQSPYGYPPPPSNAHLIPPQPSYGAWPTNNEQRISTTKAGWKSCTNLATSAMTKPIVGINKSFPRTTTYLNCGAALCDLISSKLDDVITLIDEEVFTGGEKELTITYQEPVHQYGSNPERIEANVTGLRGGGETARNQASRGANQAATTVITSTNYFSKANLYANSRLPPNLPPFRVYLPTYQLICLAARYSERVYTKPRGKEKDTHVDANWRLGTKAMVIKSVPVDDMNTIVFAIRGTQTFMDWAVNLHSAPTSPQGFLDDPGNLCHAGFLDVARKMVSPVAARLRQMLQEDPSRASSSLLITGHSAGGAVASLLYSHMLSEVVGSELTVLTSYFKRIHCITFGTPPVSLLPLNKPANRDRQLRKSLFMSFINEGDPVPRADRTYVKSLLELYALPAPRPATRPLPPPAPNSSTKPGRPYGKIGGSTSKLDLSQYIINGSNKHNEKRPPLPKRPGNTSTSKLSISNILWPVPPATLCNAGRLVVLRVPWWKEDDHLEEEVRAFTTTDDELRSVVFGDPLMHQMKVYARRVDILASKAVTGRLN